MWLDLENIILSETIQTEKKPQILYNITYMWNARKTMNIYTKQKQIEI